MREAQFLTAPRTTDEWL